MDANLRFSLKLLQGIQHMVEVKANNHVSAAPHLNAGFKCSAGRRNGKLFACKAHIRLCRERRALLQVIQFPHKISRFDSHALPIPFRDHRIHVIGIHAL